MKNHITKRRIAFACDTPLQVLNAINLKETHFSECEGDLFIYNQFQSATVIKQRLTETNIFKRVYLVNQYKRYPALVQKIATLKRVIFPYMTLKKYAEGKIDRCKYNYVAFSFITTFSLTVFGMAHTKDYLQLEDGMGTYVGDILKDCSSQLLKKIIVYTKYRNIFKPKNVCLYNPDMAQSTAPVLKLENYYSKEMRSKIEYVYDYKSNTLYENHRFVYLTQPLEEAKEYIAENGQAVDKILCQYNEQVLVRRHPRQKEVVCQKFDIDSYKNLWELECMHQIESEHILIGAFSTAQLMPKVLKNKEPYLIFLYKILYSDAESKRWQDIERFINLFSSFYENPKKVYIPKSLEELESILTKISHEEKLS